jgi:HD-GYP domain-containing protein (c-di-GMP phosphodiesterase class II)
MGIKLERYLIAQRHRLATAQAREVVNLGVAGMLHDLGKTRLPERLQRTHGLSSPATEVDRHEWESHVCVGYELVRNEVETTAAAAVLHHHQHYDGTGFPAREVTGGQKVTPDGERIHVFARILLAADIYDRLSVDEQTNRRRGNAEILHLMRTRYGTWIDPEVMAVLPKVVPPFPPGSKVKLSDRRQAIVTGIDPEDPYRPTVKPVAADGWTMTGETIALSKTTEVRIAEANGVAVGAMTPVIVAKPTAPRAATPARPAAVGS